MIASEQEVRMAPGTMGELDELLKVLRSNGVAVFEGWGLHVRFEAPGRAAPVEPPVASGPPTPAPGMCWCNHSLGGHTNGACWELCETEECAGPKKGAA